MKVPPAALPPGVVTVTLAGPAAAGGVENVSDVPVFAVVATSVPPMSTVAPLSSVPEIVTAVPPVVGPVEGSMAVIVGAAMYVYGALWVEVPPGVVTVTLRAPALPTLGTVTAAVSSVPDRIVAGVPPKLTPVAPRRLAPEMVTEPPPESGPEALDSPLTDGAGVLPVIATLLTVVPLRSAELAV